MNGERVYAALYRIYWAMRGVIAPRLKYSQYLYEDVLEDLVRPGTRWLDLGCGHQVLPSWRERQERVLVARCRTVVGLDYDLPSLARHRSIDRKVRGDMSRLPFADESFDLVTANMVVEHLDDPRAQFAEISRVLRPGGSFLFHTPNALGYFAVLARLVPRAIKLKLVYLLDGRTPDDVFPAFYRANSRRRIDALAASTDLRVDQFRLVVSDAMFAPVPPLALVELLWLRVLMTRRFRPLRTNIIAVMSKAGSGSIACAA
jgi:SAM-dependent methyltransferase